MAKPINFSPTVNVRRQIADLQRLSKSIGEVNQKTLSLVGRDVYEAAKRGVGQTAPKKRQPGSPRLVEIDGGLYRDMTADAGRPRAAGKPAKSWAPLRFLYNDIAYFLDSSTGTVVVGPYRQPWLNQLHEFGGNVTQVAWRVGRKTAEIAAKIRRRTGKVQTDQQGRQQVGALYWKQGVSDGSSGFEASTLTRTARYPARPFIQGAAGVQKAMAKASRWFKDTYYPKPLR